MYKKAKEFTKELADDYWKNNRDLEEVKKELKSKLEEHYQKPEKQIEEALEYLKGLTTLKKVKIYNIDRFVEENIEHRGQTLTSHILGGELAVIVGNNGKVLLIDEEGVGGFVDSSEDEYKVSVKHIGKYKCKNCGFEKENKTKEKDLKECPECGNNLNHSFSIAPIGTIDMSPKYIQNNCEKREEELYKFIREGNMRIESNYMNVVKALEEDLNLDSSDYHYDRVRK